MNITLSAPALATLQANYEKAPALTRQRLLGAMTGAVQHLEGEVKDEWPTGPSNSRQQITSDAFSTSAGVLGVVGTPSPYAPVIELGRKPGKGVSEAGRESIAEWAKFKLGVSEKEALGVAFLVSRKIKRQGIEAKRPFGKVLDRSTLQISRYFENAIAQLSTDLARGAGGVA